jgi:hypothetical protein
MQVSGQCDLGIGFVSISKNLPFKLLKTKSDTKPMLENIFDIKENKWKINVNYTNNDFFNHTVFSSVDSVLIFRCKSENENWFEIMTNIENGKTLWLRKNNDYIFSNWESTLLKREFMVWLSNTDVILRKEATNKSDGFKIKLNDFFVKSIDKDWIEIVPIVYSENNRSYLQSGWYQWRGRGASDFSCYFIIFR